uniref:Uncharacterized protein n=1 Tax=viral metagenome TaxID=1070528 RepID=A0A6M3XJ37_9ZZZZ
MKTCERCRFCEKENPKEKDFHFCKVHKKTIWNPREAGCENIRWRGNPYSTVLSSPYLASNVAGAG